jgi:hypothetical protein
MMWLLFPSEAGPDAINGTLGQPGVVTVDEVCDVYLPQKKDTCGALVDNMTIQSLNNPDLPFLHPLIRSLQSVAALPIQVVDEQMLRTLYEHMVDDLLAPKWWSI